MFTEAKSWITARSKGRDRGLGWGVIPGPVSRVDDCRGLVRPGSGEDVLHEVFGVVGGVGVDEAWALLVRDYKEEEGEVRELPSEKR